MWSQGGTQTEGRFTTPPPKAKAAVLQKKKYIQLSEAKRSQQTSIKLYAEALVSFFPV